MAVPKRKTSNAKKRSRRAHHALKPVQTMTCPKCQEQKLPHRVCLSCGAYGEHQVLTTDI
ncbi:50S ribosomal protein L32 [Chrysiogenes arsenatis]|uniref:50S ribosomal protein L32 n=1 Tax=Chrysiogenes arsenatis TaxID=309797 RepID=UPI0003FAC3F1|nr:50S ribosomal protein L32 [Chrysiogenes arsenatis]